MSGLQPFEGATNRTAVVVLQRGSQSRYPIPYTVWKKGDGSARVDIDKSLQDVLAETHRSDLWAQPVDCTIPTSPWLNARKATLKALQKVIGRATYQTRAGSCTWANGVYWVEVIGKRPDGLLIIKNLAGIGKTKMASAQAAIEPDLVFPLLRGRDVERWQATPNAYILVLQDPQTRKGYTESIMREKHPNLFAYMKRFEKELRSRSGYRLYFDPKTDPFYTMYNVADYTFAPYKVVWREVANGLNASVVSSRGSEQLEEKVVIPDHTLILVPCKTLEEAHFVCATLNSTLSRMVVQAYVALHPSPHVLENIAVPQFSPTNPLHVRLAVLSVQAHEAATAAKDVSAIEAEIDLAAAELWDISTKELEEIQKSLKLL